jgi:hypothetical protein
VIDFLFNVLRVLPLVSALLAVAAIRTKRQERVAQLAIAALSTLYLIVVLVVLYRFNSFIQAILDTIAQYLPIGPIQSSGWSYYLLQNILVILFFALLKALLIPLALAAVRRWPDQVASAVSSIYEYVSDASVWLISRRYGNLRRYLQVLYWTSMVFTVILIALILTFPNWPGFVGVAFPALAVLVIGELFFALDGLTEQEYSRNISGEQDSAIRIANYGPLRKILRDTFPQRVLTDDVHLTSRASLSSGFLLGELTRSPDAIDRLAGSYFSRLRDARANVDINMVHCSLDLMRGKCVLINNPFYVDLTPYISIASFHTLLQSRKVLIVSGRDSLADDLSGWIRSGLEDITGVPDMWDVAALSDEINANLHVGVLAFADVHNLDVLKTNEEFLHNVELVILAEPSRMLATGQLGLSLLLSRCGLDRVPTYVAFDGNHDGLVDSLSHLLKTSFTEVVASSLPQGASAEAVWDSDGPNMHVEIFPQISRYLGMGTEIGALALKYQVRKFDWVGGDAFPVLDMKWIAEQYYAQINRFAELDLSQDALEVAFTARANPWSVAQDDNYFLIVEDEISNAFETIRKYATRAQVTGFVNLISDNYLLRDYMVSNRGLIASDPKAIPPIVPDFARTERNLALRMIMLMSWTDVSLSDLVKEFELIGQSVPLADSTSRDSAWGSEPLPVSRLRNLITEQTQVSDVRIRQLAGFELRERSLDGTAYFRLDSSPELRRVIDSLRPAYVLVEDEKGGVNRIGSLLFDHVYQALLPGQFVTYAGKYYEVQTISEDHSRSGVVLRRAADHIRDRRSYRQWRDFTLRNITDRDTIGSRTSRDGVQMRQVSASITVETHGYFELTSKSDLKSALRVSVDGVPIRESYRKALLEVRMPDLPSAVRKTITLLLNEIFVTFFPHDHPYIIALTADEENDFGSLLSVLQGEVDQDCIYIVEDSMIDLGLIIAVERNWDRFMEVITDYLTWNASPVESQPAAPPRKEEFNLAFPEVPPAMGRKSWIRRLLSRFRWKRDKTMGPGITTPVQATTESDEVDMVVDETFVETTAMPVEVTDQPLVPEVEVVVPAGVPEGDESSDLQPMEGGEERAE